MMSTVSGFPPIADNNATILILGSMPSIKSLQAHQYYAHPQNSFWFIMSALFADNEKLDYEQKKTLLLNNRIALWDVLKSCQRRGSLDSSITDSTVEVNDFNTFFAAHRSIKAVYFNGARAEQEYRKRVLPALDKKFTSLQYTRLPSTSPAMASLSRVQKLQQWRAILQYLQIL
jgi:hypoxanthine-DNA glycosylase